MQNASENEPGVHSPAGRGSAIISERKAQIRIQRTNRTLFVVMVIGRASSCSVADR